MGSLEHYLAAVDDVDALGRRINATAREVVDSVGCRCLVSNNISDARRCAAKTLSEACIDMLAVIAEIPDTYRGVGTPSAV